MRTGGEPAADATLVLICRYGRLVPQPELGLESIASLLKSSWA